jgi:hypothetical protein
LAARRPRLKCRETLKPKGRKNSVSSISSSSSSLRFSRSTPSLASLTTTRLCLLLLPVPHRSRIPKRAWFASLTGAGIFVRGKASRSVCTDAARRNAPARGNCFTSYLFRISRYRFHVVFANIIVVRR